MYHIGLFLIGHKDKNIGAHVHLRCEDYLNGQPVRTYAVERSTPLFRESLTCSSAIYRRWTSFPTPDESGNYRRERMPDESGFKAICLLLELGGNS